MILENASNIRHHGRPKFMMKKTKPSLQVSLVLSSLMISISGLRDLGAQDQIPLNNNSGRPIDAIASGQTGQPKPLPTEPLEKYDNPPAPSPLLPTAVSPGMVSQYDSFTSYQVNVDANGMNILLQNHESTSLEERLLSTISRYCLTRVMCSADTLPPE